jgi:hypothetical protein
MPGHTKIGVPPAVAWEQVTASVSQMLRRDRNCRKCRKCQENVLIPRGFRGKFGEVLAQGFSLQKSVKICSIMKIPGNGEAAVTENLLIPRGFRSKFGEVLAQWFSLQKSVKICSIMKIPWNGEAAVTGKLVIPRAFGSKCVRSGAKGLSSKSGPKFVPLWKFLGMAKLPSPENWSFPGLLEANVCAPEPRGFPPKVAQNLFHYGNSLEWRSCPPMGVPFGLFLAVLSP